VKHQKAFAVVGAVTLATVAFIAIRKILSENPSDVSGVTSTSTGGLTTTPVKLGNVAVAAASSTLETLASVPSRALDTVRSLFIPARVNVLQPFGNRESAANASNTNRAQSVANYAPSSYALLNR
jgi:hypothetical protein